MRARAFGQRSLVAYATAFAATLLGSTGDANAQSPQLIPTRIGLVRFGGSPAVGRMYKFVSNAPRVGPLFELPSSSPATTGGSLTVTVGSGALSCTLAPGLFNGTVGWKELGNPAGSRGYKFLNKNAPTADPCEVVIVKEKAIKVIALGTGTIAAPVDHPPGNPDISTVLRLGGEDYCAYAKAPHFRERADRYIKAKDRSAPGSCPGVPTTTSALVTSSTSTTATSTTTTTSTTSISTTTTPSTTTTTLECNCCSTGLDLLSFTTTVASGSAGVLRNFRCSNNSSAACVENADCNFGTCFVTPPICSGNFSMPCTSDADCTGICEEQSPGGLPGDLQAGRLYTGAGLNAVPFPLVPDRGKSFTRIFACNPSSGELTLGATTPGEVGDRHCTSGRKCSTSGAACARDVDCPEQETCDTQCFFGAPMPAPDIGTPVTSFCVIAYVAEDASGTASCGGSVSDLSIPIRAAFHRTGDLFNSSEPPDIPGIQPCPICDTLCQGGAKDRFPCADDSDCPEGSCGSSPQCLGGLNDSSLCTPETSGRAELGDGFPTSHDCPPNPLQDISWDIGGIPLALSLTTGSMTVNAVDLPESARTFFGFCRDLLGSGTYCFEGDHTADDDPFGRCCERVGFCWPECVDDSACSGDDICLDGLCWTGCTHDSGCSEGICLAGYCLEWCAGDSECSAGFCSFAWPIGRNCLPDPCLSDSECPEDTFCFGTGIECPTSNEDAVVCTSDADCADGDEYESCVQQHPGAFSNAASTRIEVSGDTDGQCLADGESHATELVSIYPIPPTFDATVDAAWDLPGPGVALLQGEVQLQALQTTTTVPTTPTTSVTTATVPTTTTTTTTTTSSTTATTLRFVDNGDGTITDNQTGLMWERKDGTGGIHDVNNRYSWAGCCDGVCSFPHEDSWCQPNAAAASACSTETGDAVGCSECSVGTCDVDPYGLGAITTIWDWMVQVNTEEFAGYRDWRLPSEEGCDSCWTGPGMYTCPCDPAELESILLGPYPCGTSPCIDPIFGLTASYDYWSSTTNANSPYSAWYVYLVNGLVSSCGKNYDLHIRAVRGGP